MVKFRAYIDNDLDELMVYPNDDSGFIITSMGDGFSIVWEYEEYLKDDDFHIMQYAGLKDENLEEPREVYESDILEHVEGFRSVVIFKDGAYMVEYVVDNVRHYDLLSVAINECALVIGNIYENPELVKD